ncbi:MHYT domain-containing protein [Nocardiopsis sp. LOL_012]|uniref:MHYT domain-containing protein n=1 Tax=Nocardiopsis sp. LOL_012 TaxID=3345409 RepID=UPI003A8426F5
MIEHLLQHHQPGVFLITIVVAAIGSLLSLGFASRARGAQGASRWQWLALASLTLGGVAVWSMHFIAMMGYSPGDLTVRYDPLLTIVSGLLAVAVMAVALTLTLNQDSPLRLLAGGAIAGIGVVSMHYMGMFSMNFRGTMSHETGYVATAIGIALVAATVALWFATRLRNAVSLVGASLIMALAVNAMHYVGMAGVRITPDAEWDGVALQGSGVTELMIPLILGLFAIVLACSTALMFTENGRDDAPSSHNGPTDAPETGSDRRAAPTSRNTPGDDVWGRRG